jgi:hypothetical protein
MDISCHPARPSAATIWQGCFWGIDTDPKSEIPQIACFLYYFGSVQGIQQNQSLTILSCDFTTLFSRVQLETVAALAEFGLHPFG